MTEDATPPAGVLEYSDDLTTADVSAVRNFLTVRLAEVTSRQEPGTDAHFAVAALARHVSFECVQLSDDVGRWEDFVSEGKKERSGEPQTVRQDINLRWNLLCSTAAGWREHPDHSARWRELRYLCAAHQEFAESAEEGASRGPYDTSAHP